MRDFLIKLWVHYFVQSDTRAKCPACGCRKQHKVMFNQMYKALVHQCADCLATWSEQPLVPLERWEVKEPVVQVKPEEQRISVIRK